MGRGLGLGICSCRIMIGGWIAGGIFALAFLIRLDFRGMGCEDEDEKELSLGFFSEDDEDEKQSLGSVPRNKIGGAF